MTGTLLKTKLYIPPLRPNLVSRPRLIARLDQGLQLGHKLTLIAASAGSGKTTLVSKWVAGCQRPVAWLSLDKSDNDLSHFLMYLVAAVQTINTTMGAGMLKLLQSPQPLPTELLLTSLINEIAETPQEFIFVLDDYHLIEAQPIHDALIFLLDHLPPQMHLVIASRSDPPLPLARLRGRGKLTELRAADLRFTPTEAAMFLNQIMGLGLLTEQVAVLESRTEGWIVGLQMAALALQGILSMQGRTNTSTFILTFTGSHRFVLDYLVEEVLQGQSEFVRDFLLQTAILDRLSGPLCDAVTGLENGSQMLEMLEQGNLFVIPLDDHRQWYRYHHLFADVLQTRLMKEQPNQVSLVHQRASVWYEQNDLPSDAIRHALAAEDFERAAGLIELAWPAMEATNQAPTWLGWAKALPDEMIRARPVLSVGYAYALLGGGEMEDAEARLKDAERRLESGVRIVVDEQQLRSLPGAIAIGRAYSAQARGDVPGTVQYATQALDHLPEGDQVRRGQATSLLALTYWANGDLEAASQTFAHYTARLRAAGSIADAISTTFVLADIRIALGRLHEADHSIEELLHFVVNQGEPLPSGTADLYRGLGDLHRERGDLEVAAQYFLRSKALGEESAMIVGQRRLYVSEARLKQAQGDLEAALSLLDEAERLYIRTPLPDVCPVAAWKARIWIAQGRLAEAMGWARECGLSSSDDLSYLREFEHVTLARILIVHYRFDPVNGSIHEATGLLERLLHAAEARGGMGSVIEVLTLLALAHAAQDNLSTALVALERALTLAEMEGYVRLFVDEGPPMASLLAKAASQGIISDYTRLLLGAFHPAGSAQDGISTAPFAHVDALSERELEVLQCIAEGLTNQEIADRLVLSPLTVKAHARNIYGKLGAKNRTQAVARAREQGILPQS